MTRLLGGLFVIASCLILIAGADGQEKKGKGKGKGKGGFGGFGDPEATFKKLDANSDGKLTKTEFLKITDKIKGDKADKAKEFLGKAFDKMANGADSVTLDQFRKATAELGKKGGNFKKKKKAADTE